MAEQSGQPGDAAAAGAQRCAPAPLLQNAGAHGAGYGALAAALREGG